MSLLCSISVIEIIMKEKERERESVHIQREKVTKTVVERACSLFPCTASHRAIEWNCTRKCCLDFPFITLNLVLISQNRNNTESEIRLITSHLHIAINLYSRKKKPKLPFQLRLSSVAYYGSWSKTQSRVCFTVNTGTTQCFLLTTREKYTRGIPAVYSVQSAHTVRKSFRSRFMLSRNRVLALWTDYGPLRIQKY